MTFHIPSFFIGVVSFPVLMALAVLAVRVVRSLRSGASLADVSPGGVASRFEPLRFTPRLIGQLRRPLDPEEDHARAS